LSLHSLEIFFKCVINNYVFKMILPENEFSHLKGVNKQPYLDIGTYASHLTNRCLFSCFSLLFLFYYIFYIHPIGHFRVAFCLCVKTSLNAKPFIWLPPTGSFFMPIKLRFRTKNRCETKAQGNIHPWAASQGPLIFPGRCQT